MPVSDKVARLYRAHRTNGLSATTALYLARAGTPARRNDATTFGAAFEIAGRRVRWCEDVPFRFVGYADEIAPRTITHRGWYTSEHAWPGEVARGVVYQLPARDGTPRYVAGYHMPATDPERSAAIEIGRLSDITDDKITAAIRADQFAERAAEEAREYDAAWNAHRRYEELAGEIAGLRCDILAILGDARRLIGRDARAACSPAIRAVRDRVRDLLAERAAALDERADLLDTYGDAAGWRDY